jgi:hypothetical protein
MYNEMEWIIYDANQFIACLLRNYAKVGGLYYSVGVTHLQATWPKTTPLQGYYSNKVIGIILHIIFLSLLLG